MRWENRNTGKSGYAPACANEWVRGVCGKPQVKCGECPNQAFVALSDNVIASHLRGADAGRSGNADFVAGVYPILVDETSWFLAVDFDGDDWSADALAYMDTCRLNSIPAALERSRSGKGGHVWFFFSQPIPARDARQLGATLLTETLHRRKNNPLPVAPRGCSTRDLARPAKGLSLLSRRRWSRESRTCGHSEDSAGAKQ